MLRMGEPGKVPSLSHERGAACSCQVKGTMQYPFQNAPSAIAMLSLSAALGCAADPPGKPTISTEPFPVTAAPTGSPVAMHGRLRVEGTNLVDESGTRVQLKGVSSMWLNWESRSFSQSHAGLEYARDAWKLSVIRAAMGTDASNGYLNGGKGRMLSKVETIIQNAIHAGVYVLVDWHTEQAVLQQADAVEFFAGLAHRYGAHPNLIWEPYNEPRGFDWDQIRPYHEAVVNAIRAENSDNVIVMGTPNWSQDVDVAALDPVRPSAGAANLMYTLHFYSCTHQQWLRNKGTDAIDKGLALFVTEFGATPADGGTVAQPYVCRTEANLWFDWMAQNNVSGVAWKLEQCTDTSCIMLSTAPTDGPWSDEHLSSDVGSSVEQPGTTRGGGHGLLVVDWIRQ
jgi:endoglucanase